MKAGLVDPNLVLAFWGVTFLLIAVPGPDWAFILGSGTRERVVLPAVSGLMIGYGLLTGLVAGGIGAAVGQSALLLTALTTVGAGYLIYLGATVLRGPGTAHARTAIPSVPASTRSSVIRGIGVSGLNPKGLLIFVAMLPQFTDTHGPWPLPLQLVLLGLVFVATCGAFYTLIGFGARLIVGAKPAISRQVSRLAAAGMITVGLALLGERILTLAH